MQMTNTSARRRRFVTALYDRVGASAYRLVLAVTDDSERAAGCVVRAIEATPTADGPVGRADEVALLRSAWESLDGREAGGGPGRAACVLAGPQRLTRLEIATILGTDVDHATALIGDGLRSFRSRGPG